MFESNTSPDSTSTTLTINITVDHFRNKSFYYSCFLVLAGASAGQLETSQNVTVDPIDLTPPPLTSIDSLASTITLKWSDQPCTVRYSVSWMYTNDDGTTTTDSGVTELTNYTIPTSVGGVYTVSVEAVDGVGIVGPSTTEVVRSTYPQPTDDGSPPCKDRSLVLRCQESGLHDDRRSQFIWMDSSGPLTSSDQYTINGPQLTITNASAVSDNTIRCSEVLTNGITVTGVVYRVEPLTQPGPPVVTMAATDSNITLTWNTTLHCFESEIFDFVVNWNEIHNSPETSDDWTKKPPVSGEKLSYEAKKYFRCFSIRLQSSYGRLVTGWLKKKSELLTEAWQYEHTFPGELARVPSTAVQYVEKKQPSSTASKHPIPHECTLGNFSPLDSASFEWSKIHRIIATADSRVQYSIPMLLYCGVPLCVWALLHKFG
jgi:hypothetical protein